MKLSELTNYATESTFATVLSRMIVEVKPVVAHTERWLGLGIVLMAFVGGAFYAIYWFLKMRREWDQQKEKKDE